jgi:hypothetical protein
MGKTFAKIVSLLGEWSVCTYGIFGPYGVGEIQIYQDGIFCPDFGAKKISGFSAIDGSAMTASIHHLRLEYPRHQPGPLMDADGPLMEERSSRFFPFAFLAPLRETRGSRAATRTAERGILAKAPSSQRIGTGVYRCSYHGLLLANISADQRSKSRTADGR